MKVWIGLSFLAINLREKCDPKYLLADPAEVFDDPPPRPKKFPEARNETERNNRVTRDQAEIRKVNEINIERTKKVPKLGQNIFYHKTDQQFKSRLFFALGTERKKRFLQSYPHTIFSDINFKEVSTQCEGLFKKEKNFIVERMHLYNTNQADREVLQHFFLKTLRSSSLIWVVCLNRKRNIQRYIYRENQVQRYLEGTLHPAGKFTRRNAQIRIATRNRLRNGIHPSKTHGKQL